MRKNRTMTKEDILKYFDDINFVYNDCSRHDSLSNMLDELEQVPKMGNWIYDNIANNWRCDQCGETPKTMGYVGTADFMREHFKFCNHCGAKNGVNKHEKN